MSNDATNMAEPQAETGRQQTGQAPEVFQQSGQDGTDSAQDQNRPAATLREGSLKATIWRNEGQHGPFFATEITRTYKDRDGNFRDSHSLMEGDLLRAGKLADRADTRVSELRREHTQSHAHGAEKGGVEKRDFAESRTAQAQAPTQDRGR